MFTFEQILLSVVVNAAALITVLFLKSAPPRMVLYVCLVGMLAIFIPWSSIGKEVESYVPAEAIISKLSIAAGIPSTTTIPLQTTDWVSASAITLWLVIGLTWLAISILRSVHTKRVWRANALCGSALEKYANPAFIKVLRRTRIYRIANSSLVFATGLSRPEIWIGDDISSIPQIKTALNHELAHIAANDQLTLFLIVALERLLWWNPLIWLLGREARQQMEYACDSRCQSLIGTTLYRNSLAELFLVQQPRIISLELTLGNKSDIINRLEKIGMKHSTKANHILTLILAGSLTAIASASLAAQSNTEASTLMQCHELLPEGVQYDFRIASTIDTREGQEGELRVSLVDSLNPDSRDVPEGAGDFLQCVQKVVGLGDAKDWPKS